jgi:hypothetical protein
MPIDDIIRGTASASRRAVNTYRNNAPVNASVNAVAIYVGVKITGEMLGMDFKGVEYVADLAAPILGAAYAAHRLNDGTITSSNNLRTAIKTGLAALVGLELADTIVAYHGMNSPMMVYLKNGYEQIADLSRRYLNIGARSTGAVAGASVALLYRFMHHYRSSKTGTPTGTP